MSTPAVEDESEPAGQWNESTVRKIRVHYGEPTTTCLHTSKRRKYVSENNAGAALRIDRISANVAMGDIVGNLAL
jgi:hypothetical protein